MDFNDFWLRLSAELESSAPFVTLTQGKRFEAVMDGYYAVGIITSAKNHRRATMKNFQRTWDIMKGAAKDARYVNVSRRYSESSFHASYTCALIKYIVADQTMQ